MAVKVVFSLGDFLWRKTKAAADLAICKTGKAFLVKEGADPVENYRADEGPDCGGDDGSRDRQVGGQGQKTGKGQDQFGRDWGKNVFSCNQQSNGDIAIILNQLRDCLVHGLLYL